MSTLKIKQAFIPFLLILLTGCAGLQKNPAEKTSQYLKDKDQDYLVKSYEGLSVLEYSLDKCKETDLLIKINNVRFVVEKELRAKQFSDFDSLRINARSVAVPAYEQQYFEGSTAKYCEVIKLNTEDFLKKLN